MNESNGYLRYQMEMSKFSIKFIRPAMKAKQNGEELIRPQDQAFKILVYGFTEISNSYDALDISRILIKLAPPRSGKLKKSSYLKFMVGAYLQEMYILKERLNAYATKISRLYAKSNKQNKRENFDGLFKSIKATFDGITDVRGQHVHDSRYRVEHLDMLDLIRTHKDIFEGKQAEADFYIESIKSDWAAKVKANNEATRIFLDYYFDVLFVVVSNEGQIFLPDLEPKHMPSTRRLG